MSSGQVDVFFRIDGAAAPKLMRRQIFPVDYAKGSRGRQTRRQEAEAGGAAEAEAKAEGGGEAEAGGEAGGEAAGQSISGTTSLRAGAVGVEVSVRSKQLSPSLPARLVKQKTPGLTTADLDLSPRAQS